MYVSLITGEPGESLWSDDFGSLIETWEVDRIPPGMA